MLDLVREWDPQQRPPVVNDWNDQILVLAFANYETTLALLLSGDPKKLPESPFRFESREVLYTFAYIGVTLSIAQGILVRRLSSRIPEGMMATGGAVLENVVYKDGKVVNANMTNCIVPTFADAPELETIIVEVPYPNGPSGAKGVGEIPMDGPAAAVANAVENALGVPFDAIPILPEVIARKL